MKRLYRSLLSTALAGTLAYAGSGWGMAPDESGEPSVIKGHSAASSPLAVKCVGRPAQSCRPATRVAQAVPLPGFEVEAEPEPDETLAQALDAAYHTAPSLQAQRYTLRASDEDYAQALSELRPTTGLQVTGDYTRTIDGRTTLAQRFSNDPLVVNKVLTVTATANQPLYRRQGNC
jgi:outer membrane protein